VTRFVFQGSGHTVGGSGRALLVVLAVLVLAGSGTAAVAQAVIDALFAFAGLVLLLTVAFGVWLARYARRRERNPSPHGIVPAPVRYELPGPERPAIETRPQVVNNFFGVSAAEVAEIIRHQAE
jgi:hypothetical protein